MNIDEQIRSTAFAVRLKLGFTLVELLATMAILALLIAFLGQVFSQASLAWNQGTQQAIRNANAKAALELLARELEMAVVDSDFVFWKDRHGIDGWTGLNGWPIDYDRLFFITLGGTPEDGRSYQAVRYEVRLPTAAAGYLGAGFRSPRLWRSSRDFAQIQAAPNNENPFGGDSWAASIPFLNYDNVTVIDDIVRFDVYLYSGNPAPALFGRNPTALTGNTADNPLNRNHDYNTHDPTTLAFAAHDQHRVPPYIDIYLQVASPDAMRRAYAVLSPPITTAKKQRAKEIMDANSNVLFKRVYPRMREAIP